MLDANYQKHFKILGKFAKLYDTAAADVTAQETLAATTYDQIATGVAATSWAALQLLNPYTGSWASAIASGSTQLMSLSQSMAAAYLTSAIFRADMTAVPTNTSSAQSVLEALITEMTNDVKTLTTAASTGFVHFFELWSPTGDFPQSGSASYTDATYVVSTVV